MTSSEWVVLAGGIAAILWVNWYFFMARRGQASAAQVAGTQEVVVTVKGGYDPAVIRVRHGQPVRNAVGEEQGDGNDGVAHRVSSESVQRTLDPLYGHRLI